MQNATVTKGEPEARPLLRGYVHFLGAIVSPFALVALILIADSPRAIVGAAIFGASLILAFSTSAGYHLLRWRGLRRLDHAMIYVLIAGTFTPFTLKVLGNAWGIPVLAVVWGLAGVGVVQSLLYASTSRWLNIGPYLVLGWAGVIPAYKVWQTVPHLAFALLLLGGAVYSLGGLVYAARRPNPIPALFGYHEVFHVLTLAATGVFYLVVARYVLPR